MVHVPCSFASHVIYQRQRAKIDHSRHTRLLIHLYTSRLNNTSGSFDGFIWISALHVSRTSLNWVVDPNLWSKRDETWKYNMRVHMHVHTYVYMLIYVYLCWPLIFCFVFLIAYFSFLFVIFSHRLCQTFKSKSSSTTRTSSLLLLLFFVSFKQSAMILRMCVSVCVRWAMGYVSSGSFMVWVLFVFAFCICICILFVGVVCVLGRGG